MPRSRALTIAPAIPALGIVGFIGIDKLHGTPWLLPFVLLWSLLLAALFVYVFNKMMQARRTRPGR